MRVRAPAHSGAIIGNRLQSRVKKEAVLFLKEPKNFCDLAFVARLACTPTTIGFLLLFEKRRPSS
jgi:hypothetical protein